MNKPRFCLGALSIVLVFLLSGCGGVKSTANGGTAALPTSGGAPSTGGGSVSSPIIVQVGSGSTVAGISITVPSPATSTPPNAQVLGVFSGTGTASASNTGDIIHRGQTASVLLFGPGLDGSMQVTIGGPTDIQVSNVHSITSTAATGSVPGVAFTAVVNGNAALGARTVFLTNSKNDITAFAGGLEVVQ